MSPVLYVGLDSQGGQETFSCQPQAPPTQFNKMNINIECIISGDLPFIFSSLCLVNNFTCFSNASLIQHFYVSCEFHFVIAKPRRSFWFTEHSVVHVCCIDVKMSRGSLENTLYMYIIYFGDVAEVWFHGGF